MIDIVVAYIQFGHFGDNVVEHYDNIEGTLEDGPFYLDDSSEQGRRIPAGQGFGQWDSCP